MFLIVFGHVVGGDVNMLTPPIYHKQWGVTLFLFATGYTLARERRPTWRVVINRLFEILLIGLLFALASTAVSLARGDGALISNYSPFVFGANVLVDHFPANPTTWYIGTYIHLIALWAIWGRHLRPTPSLLLIVACVEVLVRAVVWSAAGGFIAYMVVPNWMTVWLLGVYAAQRHGDAPAPRWTVAAAAVAMAAPIVAGLVTPFDAQFPFRGVPAAGTLSPLVTSVCVTLIYSGGTWLAFAVTSGWPRVRIVEFLASQTIFIFVAHMPLYYGLLLVISAWPRWLRAIPLILACYFGLALAGAAVYRVLRPVSLREQLVRRFVPETRLRQTA